MIADGQASLNRLHALVWPPKPTPQATSSPAFLPSFGTDEVLDRFFRAANGEDNARLFAGDMCGYASESEARAALLRRLIFWTGRDPNALETLLRASGRDPKRFDERRGGETFAAYEVRRAIESYTGPIYDPARAESHPKPPEVTYVTADTSTDARIAALEAKIAAQEARIGELERRLAEERASRSELVYALRNKAVKTERGTAIAAACLLEHKKGQNPAGVELPGKGDGWHHVYLDAVAEQAGCSPQRASAHLDRLAEWGVLEKTVQWSSRDRINPETGEITREGVKEMYLRTERPLSHTLAVLATIEPEKPQTWGGKRPKACPDHPEAGTVKRWSLHCQECDRLLDKGEEHQRPPSFQDEGSSIGATVVVDPSFQDESRGKRPVRTVRIPSWPATDPYRQEKRE